MALVRKFNVNGMSDEQCTLILERALGLLPGVKQTKASLEDKSITVSYEPKITSQDDLIRVILEEGYDV